MLTQWRFLLPGVAVVFVLFLLLKMRPAMPLRAAVSAELRAARERVRAAATDRERAIALCDAGDIAARTALRFAAAGYFLRAMRADAAWPGAIERAAAALQRRPRHLERILWRRLSELPWDDDHKDALRAAASALSGVYRGRLHDRLRAEFMDKFVEKFG